MRQHLRISAGLFLLLLTSERSVGQSPGRTEWPLPRINHAMCESVGGKHVLLFGGRAPGRNMQRDSTLWSWDGNEFKRLASDGPAIRSSMQLACHPTSSRAVLYGGYSSTVYGDTWEWSGSGWRQSNDAGMPPRVHPAMAFDPSRGTVILFGGFFADRAAPLDETWEWNGERWVKLSAVGPPARYGHAMVTDTHGQRIILYGGSSGFGDANRTLTDTWEWKNGTWSQIASGGPPVLVDQSVVVSPEGIVTLVGSRESGDSSLTVHQLRNGTWVQLTTVNSPSARVGHTAVFDRTRTRIVVFGGHAGGRSAANDELWELEGTTWHHRRNPRPGP